MHNEEHIISVRCDWEVISGQSLLHVGGDKWGVTVGIRKVGSGYRECPTAPNSHVAQPLALPTSSDSPTARQCPTVPDSADSDPSRDHLDSARVDSARQCSTVLDSA